MKSISFSIITKFNINKINIKFKNYTWKTIPFFKKDISLRLFNFDENYLCFPYNNLGLFILEDPDIPKSITIDKFEYNEDTIMKSSKLIMSSDDIKYIDFLWYSYLLLPNDILRKIKYFLDSINPKVYWMPYEPGIDWFNIKN